MRVLPALRRLRGGTRQQPAPFVVGVPRSGTTLLRLMLDAHPEMTIPPETHFAPKLIRRLRDLEPIADPRAAAHELLTEHPRWADFGIDGEELRRRFDAAEPFDATAALRAFYVLYAEKAGKPRWGDKTPRYMRRMRLLHRTLPEARFINLIRDGRDVALSLADVSWGTDQVREAAERWVEDLERARRMAGHLDHYLELRYEDLVEDPEPPLRLACEFVELRWADEMLDFHEGAAERMSEVVRDFSRRSGAVITAEERRKQHELVARPPSSDRTGRWRTEMSAEDVATFDSVAGGLLAELGYER